MRPDDVAHGIGNVDHTRDGAPFARYAQPVLQLCEIHRQGHHQQDSRIPRRVRSGHGERLTDARHETREDVVPEQQGSRIPRRILDRNACERGQDEDDLRRAMY